MAYNGSSSASDRLARVRDMMEKVLGGAQEYYVGSRRTRYPSLSELRDLEESLVDEVAMEANAGFIFDVGARVPPS